MHMLINMILTRGIAFNDMADETDPTILPLHVAKKGIFPVSWYPGFFFTACI
jgi:hypothetical protein